MTWSLVILLHCVAVPIHGWGQDAIERPPEIAKLQTHQMASGLSANIVERFSSIVPRGRMMYLGQSGQLVVYATPGLQKKIADRIRSERTIRITADRSVLPEADEARGGGELDHAGIRSLPLPRHPVQILHLKDLDLLIITSSQ